MRCQLCVFVDVGTALVVVPAGAGVSVVEVAGDLLLVFVGGEAAVAVACSRSDIACNDAVC